MAYKNYYQILGLDKTASADQIKKAYRKLAMQYHPDRNHGQEEWANEKFKEINEAFSIIGEPEKRKQYDQFGTVRNVGDIFSSQATRTTFNDLMKDFEEVGLGFNYFDDIFGDITHNTRFSFHKFSKGFDSVKRTKFETLENFNLEDLFPNPQSSLTNDANYEITLTPEQAAKGLEKELVRNEKKLKVKIPANVRSDSEVRLKNALQLTDGTHGDIIIHIKVK